MRAVLLPAIIFTTLPLSAQEQEVLPDTPKPSETPVPIEPVPVPEGLKIIPDDNSDLPDQPESIRLSGAPGSTARLDADRNVFLTGPIEAVTDNNVTINARDAKREGSTGKIYLDGSVRVNTHTGIEIFADHAIADPATQILTLTGDVRIFRGGILQRGTKAVLHWKEQKLEAEGLRASVDPILLEAGKFEVEERDGKQVYVGHQAGVTTHDVEDPGFWLRSNETVVYPDKVTFRNLKLYAGETPIFWLPYLSQPLDSALGYHFIPGARSNWGGFLLNSYGILLGEGSEKEDPWLLSRWHFDVRTSRGIGTGVDLSDKRLSDNPNLTGLSLYYTNDLDPSMSRTGFPRGHVNEDRYRLALQHRINFDWEPQAEWRLDANLNILSDEYYLEDFEPEKFRSDPQPDNTIGLFRRDDASLFSFYTRLRPNEFYRSDTRMPEIAFDLVRRPIFGTSILHEGNTSFAVVDEQIGSPDAATARAILARSPGDPAIASLLNRLPTYERQLIQQIRALPVGSTERNRLISQLYSPSYSRFNTYQELSRPINFGGWLNIIPEMGVGYTRYFDASGAPDDFDVFNFHAGVEASVKFSKDYGNVVNRSVGLDGMLHVVQPYVRYSYVASDDTDPYFGGVDRETFSTRPQTLAVSRFPAVDSLRDWNIARLGTRNRLLTHRDGQTFEWLSVNTYIDAYLTDPDYSRDLSNLYNDIKWDPLPWFGTTLETQFPVVDDGDGFSEVAARARFMPNENVEFSIGERFLDNHPVLQNSNRIDLRTYLRIGERWGLGMLQLWELDDGTLEIQQYTLHHDFNHWVASIGLTKQDNRVDNEYGVVLSFTLKDFPSATLPLKMDAQ